jgi:hypothetical protein
MQVHQLFAGFLYFLSLENGCRASLIGFDFLERAT